MATVPRVVTEPGSGDDYQVHTWTLAATNDGETLIGIEYADRTVQIISAGAIVWQGSNNGTDWVTLKDSTGSAISGAGVFVVAPVTLYQRPYAPGGVSGTVICVARRTNG